MSAIASYRTLLRTVGSTYVVVAFLGRIPLAMSQLGTLILVSTQSGRYALGGAAAGALAVANALGAPFAGGLADRVGQRPVVLGQSIAGAIGLLALVEVTHRDLGAPTIIAVSALAGLAIPQIGPLARVRWGPVVRDAENRAHVNRHRLLDAAFSYEGAADEASFVLGPALVGVLAVIADPAGALLCAAAVLAAFGSWFALHPTAALTGSDRVPGQARGRLFGAAFLVLVVAQMCVGTIFGGTQTGSTVLATAEGQPGLAGVIHATLGVGSVIAGLAVTGLPEQVLYATRMLVSAAGLLVLSAPLLLVDSIGPLMGVIGLLGFAVAPYMISNFALAGHLVADDRIGMAMTMLAGATGVGYALGSSVAGRLADAAGSHTPAFAVTVTAAALALLLSLAAQQLLRNARPPD
ncbi:MFS transporter [Aeromicrobium sp.]|uniref:MFS transporter n=1 Tax=Aeromicrobium sp. TaxID=1871063 RepID=UPI003C640C06